MVAKSNNGLVSVTCFSEISKPCLWSMFIYNASQQFIFILYLYCMALRVLEFHLLDKIGACYVRYAWRTLRWDYYFLCTGGVLYALKILLYRIVQHRLYCMNYI